MSVFSARGRAGRRGGGRMQAFVDLIIFLVVVVFIWQFLAKSVVPQGLERPLPTVSSAIELLRDSDFWRNVAATGWSLAMALVVAMAGGICAGLFLGFNRLAADVFEPIIVVLYATPKIMFYPIFMMVFGLGSKSSIAFGVFHGVLPIILFAMSAVRDIKPVYFKTGHAMNLGTWQTMWTIAAPATVPEIFTGLRVGFASVTVGTLLSEMFCARAGIGYMLMNAIVLNQINIIMPITLLIVVVVVVTNMILLAIDKRLHH